MKPLFKEFIDLRPHRYALVNVCGGRVIIHSTYSTYGEAKLMRLQRPDASCFEVWNYIEPNGAQQMTREEQRVHKSGEMLE